MKVLNSYFEKKLQQIRDDCKQLEAYNAEDSTVVIAGPGSGKTTVLTLKVMQLLNERIHEPRGLACLTYSVEAAREFKDRLKNLGLQKRKNVFLGTVHSFCLSEIIMPFSSLYPKYKLPNPIRIISEKQKKKLFSEQNYEGSPKLDEVDKERSRNIDGLSMVAIDSYDVALKAAIAFEKVLLENGYIDFISMVKISVDMLMNESYVRKSLEAKYPWIVIDEYQDLGRPLHEIVLLLMNMTSIRFFAVGDSDQSIYDFQGAAPDYLEELSNRRDVNHVLLRNNYRSSQTIVDASEYVLNSSRGYIASGSLRDYNATLEFYECNLGMDEQYEKTIDLINKYHKSGIPYHEIAVLVGNNTEVNNLSKKCTSHNIPSYISRQAFRISDLIVWLHDCTQWISNKETTSFDNICSTWRRFLIYKQIVDENDYLGIRKTLFRTLDNSLEYRNDLLQWLKYMDENLQIVKTFDDSVQYPDEIDNYNKLISFLEAQEMPLTINYLARLGLPENQVVLSTRHSSKGLEFDVVIMLGMEKDSFPHYYDNTPRKQDEARRLCFVAVSRARKACVLIRSKKLCNKYGKCFLKEPSPFWVSLKEFQEKRDTKGSN